MLEPYVHGRELTVGLLHGKALGVGEICPKEGFYDYHNKYTEGACDYFFPALLDDTVAGTMLSGTVAGDGGLVLRAYYAAEEHTVTYAYSDATPAGATVLPEVQTYLTGATVTVAPNATLAGYDFSGWQMNENGSPVVKAAGSTFVMPAGDVVLTGSFQAGPEGLLRPRRLQRHVRLCQRSDNRSAGRDGSTGHGGGALRRYGERGC